MNSEQIHSIVRRIIKENRTSDPFSLARSLGIDVDCADLGELKGFYVVYGTGRGDGDHYWNQVKINGVWTNYDTCNMYANVTDAYLKTQGNGYTWKQYVYPTFN